MQTIKELCRELRKNQTKTEDLMWRMLRNRRFTGKKFLRQHPLCVRSVQGKVSFYIADFYCAEHKLVIEVDGPIHEMKKEYDKNRDEVMQAEGLRILRFTNDEVNKNPQKVLEQIAVELSAGFNKLTPGPSL